MSIQRSEEDHNGIYFLHMTNNAHNIWCGEREYASSLYKFTLYVVLDVAATGIPVDRNPLFICRKLHNWKDTNVYPSIYLRSYETSAAASILSVILNHDIDLKHIAYKLFC